MIPAFSQTEQQDTVIKPLPDTLAVKDTVRKILKPVVAKPVVIKDTVDSATVMAPAPVLTSDSVSFRPLFSDTVWQVSNNMPLRIQILERHPYFDFRSKPLFIHSNIRQFKGQETMFYALAAFLLVFALIRQWFNKYFSDLLRVFFRSSLKQRQIRDQLMQAPLPSLVFNIFFVASTGLYIDFVLRHFNISPVNNFWLLYLYCALALAIIYFVKFIGLKITGWLFNMKKAADSYSFIVFSINKIIGIFLVPFPLILAFTTDPLYTIALVFSWCCIGALLVYRFILGFSAIRNEVRFNLFHFVLYLCAFELAPLLLIYRLLLLVF